MVVFENLEHVSAIVAAVSLKPVNLLINAPFTTAAEAAPLGVRRISVGGTLARTAWDGFLKAAGEIAKAGMNSGRFYAPSPLTPVRPAQAPTSPAPRPR